MENNHLAELLYYYRLKKDLELTEEKIQNNQLVEINEEQNAIVRFWNKNVENPIRSEGIKKYTSQKEDIEKSIKAFSDTHNKFDYEEYAKDDKIKDYVDKELKKDKFSLLRANLALLTVLEDGKFYYVEETKAEISKILYNNVTTVEELGKKLEKNYIKICGKSSFDEIGKKVLIGIGLATAVATLTSGLLVGGALAELVTGSLIYSAMVVGGSALIYKIFDIGKKELLKEEFRKLSADDAGAMLAIKTTLIEEASKVMSKKEFTEYLDSTLKLTSDLRSDTEFMLLVEKENVEQAKEKLKVFNNWTGRLSNILVSQ